MSRLSVAGEEEREREVDCQSTVGVSRARALILLAPALFFARASALSYGSFTQVLGDWSIPHPYHPQKPFQVHALPTVRSLQLIQTCFIWWAHGFACLCVYPHSQGTGSQTQTFFRTVYINVCVCVCARAEASETSRRRRHEGTRACVTPHIRHHLPKPPVRCVLSVGHGNQAICLVGFP